MRLLPLLFLLPLLALQAHAQSTVPQPAAPPAPSAAGPQQDAAAPVTAAPGIAAPAPAIAADTASNGPASATAAHHRTTWKQHFAQANIAHDGHLTFQEANGGFPTVARHFKEIDADKKGYVTEEDITNWHKLQRATHHPASTEQGLRPRPAFQQGATAPRPMNTSAAATALPMSKPDASSAK